jgi:type IV pilus assembly protein PilE
MKYLPSLSRSRARGFTLIELMVTVAIIGILMRVAFPAYMQSVRKSHRAEAKTALLDLAQRQERFMSTANVYSLTPTALGYPSGTTFPMPILAGSTPYYNLSVTGTPVANPTTFVAQAIPIGKQALDPCGTFQIDNTGNQTATGTAPTGDCW